MADGAQQARVLLCGREGAGQGHLGPALLAALEALPVHAVGLPSLLSDANSRRALRPLLLCPTSSAPADVWNVNRPETWRLSRPAQPLTGPFVTIDIRSCVFNHSERLLKHGSNI